MTLFENQIAMLKSRLGEFDGNGKKIVYREQQMECEKNALILMTKGVYSERKWFHFYRFKNFYGLKGRSAKDALPEFIQLMDNYLKKEYGR